MTAPTIQFSRNSRGDTLATYGGETWTFSLLSRCTFRAGYGSVRDWVHSDCTPEGELTRAVLDSLGSLRVPTLASRVYDACEQTTRRVLDRTLGGALLHRLAPRHFASPTYPGEGYREFDRRCRVLDTVYGLTVAPGDVGALATLATSDPTALPALADACEEHGWDCGAGIRDLWSLLGRPV